MKSFHYLPRFSFVVRATPVLLGAASLLAGCLSRPALKVESFAFETPAVTGSGVTSTNILALKSVTIAPTFEGQQFVYRTGDQTYERDPYAMFLVPPARMLMGTLAAHLRNGAGFADVLTETSPIKTSRSAQVYISELYGDFRKPEEAAAVLTLRFVLVVSDGAALGQSIWQREVSRRVALTQRTAAALAAGWNDALVQSMAEINSALKSLP